jgi:creatinine amidohydrolase
MEKVRYIELRPAEFRTRLTQKPVAYLPLGTLEWHGEHLPLGADAIQSEALMVECARRFGGIVLPPLFLGPDQRKEIEGGRYLVGMDTHESTQPHQQLAGSAYWVADEFFLRLLDAILEQVKRAGFKAVFADGHGPSRRLWVNNIPANEKRFGLKLLGTTDDLKEQWPYMVDHAAKNETSITMHVRPDCVDLSVFPDGERSQALGVGFGGHPCKATEALGKEAMEKAIEMVRRKLEAIS